MVHGVTIQKNVELSNKKYDKMVSNFFAEQPYLAGRGGWAKDGTRYAIRVTSQNRNTLLIDPQGYNYARYVGFEIN